jgi:tetratricopeptide (TPR) repeat protein
MSAEQPSRNAAQRRVLPWLIAAAALVVYFVTLNRWITPGNSALVQHATGWNDLLPIYQPLLHLLTMPLQWLPPVWVPILLNGLTAILAALTLALLAHSVLLLPQDRTRDQRMRERSHGGLLSIPHAWVPPALAVLVCGLELTFWRNAITATGEMLDLLIFAALINCLLRFRVSKNDRWLFVFTALYGAGTANNYALISFFPAFFVAFVWIKGLDILNTRFLLISIGLGLAGLCLYSVLPLIHVMSDLSDATLWQVLKANLVAQKMVPHYYLVGVHRLFLLALLLTSVVPVFLFGIRWSSSVGDTNAVSVILRDLMFHTIHVGFFIVCIAIAFNPRFSPYEWSRRESGASLPFLTLYYLGALAVGYCAGYLLLVFGREPVSAVARSTSTVPRPIKLALVSLVWLALVATPAGLVYTSIGKVRAENSPALSDFATVLGKSLPSEKGVAFSDDPMRLLLARAELERTGRRDQWLLVDSRLITTAAYNRKLHRVRPDIWPELPKVEPPWLEVPHGWLVETLASVAEQVPVYYLHPSFGYYFEVMHLEPNGLAFKLTRYPPDSLKPPPLTTERVEAARRFWSELESTVLRSLISPIAEREFNALTAGFLYSRNLNWWGVELQKNGQLGEAGKAFGLATNLNPENLVAQINAEFNTRLQQGQTEQAPLPKTVEDTFKKYRSWEHVMMDNGPFDEPRFCHEAGQVFFQGNLFRQAGQQFLRTIELNPAHLGANLLLTQLYLTTGYATNALRQIQEVRSKAHFALSPSNHLDLTRLEIMAWLVANQTNLAEHLIGETHNQGRTNLPTLGMLSQIRILQNRLDEALTLTDEMLQLRMDDPNLLLNKSALLIQTSNYSAAIPVLDQLLTRDSKNPGARLNRAIAQLKAGKLREAQRDYETLLNNSPSQFNLHFGLGEIGEQTKDREMALRHYRLYLKNAPPGTVEADEVRRRIKALEGAN